MEQKFARTWGKDYTETPSIPKKIPEKGYEKILLGRLRFPSIVKLVALFSYLSRFKPRKGF
jgi:hypothetical protein